MFSLGASKIAHWVKALASKPKKPNLIPGTQMVEGENRVLQVVL